MATVDGLVAASAAPVSNERISGLNKDLRGLEQRIRQLFDVPSRPTPYQEIGSKSYLCLKIRLNTLSHAVLPPQLTALAGVLSGLEARTEALETAINASGDRRIQSRELSKELNSINEDGSRLWDKVRNTSVNVDHIGPAAPPQMVKFEDGRVEKVVTPYGRLVDLGNDLHARIAALSHKLRKLQNRLGAAYRSGEYGSDVAKSELQIKQTEQHVGRLLKDPFEAKDTERPVSAVYAAKPPGRFETLDRMQSARSELVMSKPRRMLLDMHEVPSPARPSVPLPSVPLPQEKSSFFDKIAAFLAGGDNSADRFSADPRELRRIIEMRDSGQTVTVGDPGGRAKYVFRQTGSTCGIAAQVQVRLDAGAVEPGQTGKHMEDELYDRAVEEGFFTGQAIGAERRWEGGTPSQFLGNVLDSPVQKHYNATDQELLSAVRTGKMILIPLDAGLFWNDPKYRYQGHVVAITGAEINKAGELLGYYVNDTGTNQGGRLVAAGQFLEAWHNRRSFFVEPL